MASKEHERSVQPWGTLEELLLACAVNRHGTKRWDSVATELQIRSSSAAGLTPELCRKKFHDLKRRFASQNHNSGDESDSGVLIPMVDELTKLRLDDLRRDLRRRDLSIVSLETKVKRLEEERETIPKTENDESLGGEERDSPENRRVGSKSSESNRSFNESNSTTQASRRKRIRNDVVSKEKEKEKEERESDRRREKEEEEDNETVVRESNSAKQSSEVQSSSKRRRREDESPATATTKRISAIKSEPFVRILGIVRSHRLGSVFQRRLRSQESQRYKNMVRQHMDLQTIEVRLEKGVYSDHSHKFFRDLILVFSNAVVFFKRGSQENLAARELRSLVFNEMKTIQQNNNNNNKKLASKSKPLTSIKTEEVKHESDNLVAPPKPNKNKSSIIVTCGKRTGLGVGTNNNNDSSTTKLISQGSNKKVNLVSVGIKKSNGSSEFVGVEENSVRKKRREERGLVRRGLRNGSSGSTTNNSPESSEREFGGNELSSHDNVAAEVKTTTTTSEFVKKDSVKKKQGAASFLKRMKQNSPKEVENNDEEEEESDVEKEEEDNDDNKDEEGEEEDERKKKVKNASGASASASKDQKRVTRNAAARGRAEKEESNRKGKRGVGRPPKRPEKAVKKAVRDSNVESGRSLKKRSRR